MEQAKEYSIHRGKNLEQLTNTTEVLHIFIIPKKITLVHKLKNKHKERNNMEVFSC